MPDHEVNFCVVTVANQQTQSTEKFDFSVLGDKPASPRDFNSQIVSLLHDNRMSTAVYDDSQI